MEAVGIHSFEACGRLDLLNYYGVPYNEKKKEKKKRKKEKKKKQQHVIAVGAIREPGDNEKSVSQPY